MLYMYYQRDKRDFKDAAAHVLMLQGGYVFPHSDVQSVHLPPDRSGGRPYRRRFISRQHGGLRP